MIETGEAKVSEDQGFPFLVVRMVAPSSNTLESLEPDLRDRALANLERARRIFRSRTLPCPGSDTRLGAPFDMLMLSSEIDTALIEGINDEGALAIFALPPAADDGETSTRIQGFELRFASTLLGKYWYRHREMDIFDAVKLVEDLTVARGRGESDLDILHKSKPPPSPRRRK
jgi:hypothetical protein